MTFRILFLNVACTRFFKRVSLPLVLLMIFPLYFTYDLYTGKMFFSHPDYAGMYFPFRDWFLQRLTNFDFPIWNPYWGLGHEMVIWASIPIDPYSIFEFLFGPQNSNYFLIQSFLIVVAGYYVFRKFHFTPWVATMGSLFFYLSPLITYWNFMFLKTNFFIAFMFVFLFLIRWFQTCQIRYVLLMGWSFYFGMFGTKLEYWFFGAGYVILASIIAAILMRPKQPSMIALSWISIIAAIVAQAWQMNLLVNAMLNSNRKSIPHSIYNLFSSEMYKNLILSLGDSDFFAILFIGLLFFIALQKRTKYPVILILTGILFSVILQFWKFSFIYPFLRSPLFFGAILATILVGKRISIRNHSTAWLLFMLPAHYWCRPLVNVDELWMLSIAPSLFKFVWGFFIWLGCAQLPRYRIVQFSYLSVILVLFMEVQGQIILSYLFGYLWFPARDNFLIDFSFTIIALFGTKVNFRHKPLIVVLAPFIIAFAAYPNLLYVLPEKAIPGYANPLLRNRLPYDPYSSVPQLKEILNELKTQPQQ